MVYHGFIDVYKSQKVPYAPESETTTPITVFFSKNVFLAIL